MQKYMVLGGNPDLVLPCKNKLWSKKKKSFIESLILPRSEQKFNKNSASVFQKLYPPTYFKNSFEKKVIKVGIKQKFQKLTFLVFTLTNLKL